MKRIVALGAAAMVSLATAGCTAAPDPTPSPSASPAPTQEADLEELFALPSDPAAAAAAAGLPTSAEAALSARVHLDVVVDGTAVSVPAGIGAGEAPGEAHALLTRDPTGIVLFDPTSAPTLGQLLTAWGVPLEGSCLGELCVDNVEQLLLVYKDGKPVGDPVNLALSDGSELFVWVGPAGTVPPVVATYQFPP